MYRRGICHSQSGAFSDPIDIVLKFFRGVHSAPERNVSIRADQDDRGLAVQSKSFVCHAVEIENVTYLVQVGI